MITKIQNIPSELKQVDQWVCWVGNDKIPKNPYTGYNAKSNDKSTWSDFKRNMTEDRGNVSYENKRNDKILKRARLRI